MCRKLVVTNEIFLGARAICYEAYSLPKGEVVELTEKQIKDTLKGFTTDRVYGLRLSEAGELELDTDDFFTTNMMKKIHTNTLVPMVEDACLANLFYIVIGTHKEKGNTMYDVISSRYERTSFTEEKLYAVAKLMESCASHLYVTETISVEEEDLSRRIEAYIMKKIHKGAEITIEDICDEF